MVNIKKKALTIVAIICSFIGFSQCPEKYPLVYDGRYVRFERQGIKLKGRTLLVVVDDSTSVYGKALISGFSKFWTLTSVRYIKSTELSYYMESDQYAIFAFVIQDMYSDEVRKNSTLLPLPSYIEYNAPQDGTLVQGDNFIEINKLVDGNSVPEFINKADYNNSTRQSTLDNYSFQILLCGSFVRTSKAHNLANLEVCDMQDLDLFTDATKPVSYYQADITDFIIPTIIRFQRILGDKMSGKQYNIEEEKVNVQVNEEFKRNGKLKVRTFNETYVINNINNLLVQLKGKKILIDQSVCSTEFVKLTSLIIGCDSSDIKLTTRDTIRMAFEKKDNSVVILDYTKLSYTPVQSLSNFALFLTDGTMLATFQMKYHNPFPSSVDMIYNKKN